VLSKKRVGVTALVALVAAGAASAPTQAVGPAVSVETLQMTFVDEGRSTDATASAPAQEQRVLDTTITYPVGIGRRLPLIVLAHGNNGHPNKFTQLLGAWAAAGYVIAAPAFPLTSNLTPGGSSPGDARNQPADVSFVIDEVLRISRPKADSALAGLVDTRRIGVAGLSLGGSTAYAVVHNTCCRDKRIDAVVLMSALGASPDGRKDARRHVPALVLHSDADPQYRLSAETYQRLATPKWLVTLHGSSHSGPFEDRPDPADAAVPSITIAFWDRYLKGDRSAQKRLVNVVTAYGAAEIQHELR
jgi:dienelactone hydrolase